MAIRETRKISELNALTSASLNTVIAGVDNGQTYKIPLSVLSETIGSNVNVGNIAAQISWNSRTYTLKNTEELTFSNDYILENSVLHIEGSDIEVEYSPNKYIKKIGTIFIGGNLLVKDSVIVNDGLIGVGGQVILIGNSQITGTGTII